GLPSGPKSRADSSQRTYLIIEQSPLDLIIVFGARACDLRPGQIQLRLAQLNHRAESQIVSALRQVESELRLVEQLRRQSYAFIRRLRVQIRNPYIPDNPVLQIFD